MGSGESRALHVRHLRETWGKRFEVLGEHGIRSRVHGRELADRIASARIIVAPDGPQTDRYWSNRVYLTLGFAGFLLHPYCEELAGQYRDGVDLLFYRSREECDALIGKWLEAEPYQRWAVSEAGYERTVKMHLYRHRCEKLIEVVKERLGK